MDQDDLKDLKSACYNSHYGKCYGGSVYSECARTVNTTCKDLFSKSTEKYANQNNQNHLCVAGCSCPEDQYFEKINNQLQCVTKSSCTCYDMASNRYYQPNDQIKRACSTW